MKVLHVITCMDPLLGGVSQAIATMVNGLNAAGVYSEVVCLDDPATPYIQNSPFKVIALGKGSKFWCYNRSLEVWLTIHMQKYEVVIMHALWQYPGYAVAKVMRQLAAQRKQNQDETPLPKVFAMPHGMLDPYFQKAKGRAMKALRNSLYWTFIEKKLINNADGLLFTCETEQRLARLPFKPYRPKDTKVVSLGVENPPVFAESMLTAFLEKCPELKGSQYLLFLGRVDEKKGVDMLIKAYMQMAKNVLVASKSLVSAYDGPEQEAIAELPKLVIAGPGTDSPFGKQVQHIVSSMPGMQDNILFTGMLTGDTKWGAFYGAEAFVLPSHQENFGIAVVEAMACGKPVLISNQINIWREIKDTNGGFVASDTEAGTLELLKTWHSLSEQEKLSAGLNARLCYENKFAVSAATRQLLQAVAINL